jgi:hypothetical protein
MTTRMLLHMFRQAGDDIKKELISANEQSREDPVVASEGLRQIREQWRGMYAAQRILCFTERWDSASMWDRYSAGHTGILLEFGCLDHMDSAWLVAKPVVYSDSPIRPNTPDGLAALMLYDITYGIQKIMEEFTHTKTEDWAYEREWRIASWKRPHEFGDYSDYQFLREELTSVTFGAAISDQDRSDLIAELRTNYPDARLWQASVEGGRRLTRREV